MEGFLSEIFFFGGNFAPQNWALCNGQLLAISSNDALFALIGTIYGGDGRTTFALPDYRGRVPVGSGNGSGLPSVQLGEKFGSTSNTLTMNEMPPHTHPGSVSIGVSERKANKSKAENQIFATPDLDMYTSTANTTAQGGSMTLGSTGGGQPFNIMQPYLGLNFIICEYGIFPSRS